MSDERCGPPCRNICPDPCCGRLLQDCATPAERAAADELTRELDTVSAEPSLTQVKNATAVVMAWGEEDGYGQLVTLIANALAAERAAIHARYEALAAECDDAPDRDDMSEDWQDGRDEALLACSARIRQVAAG